MDAFNYLAVLISIILGLGIAQLLGGFGRWIEHRKDFRAYAPASELPSSANLGFHGIDHHRLHWLAVRAFAVMRSIALLRRPAVKRALILGSIVVLLAAAAWAHWPRSPLAAGVVADRIVVYKADRRLELLDDGELLRSYSVSLGREPVGPKVQQGDKRTPEGRYTIDYRNPESSYHLASHVSYPRPHQAAAAKALGVSAGGLIMIHGLTNGAGWLGRLHLLSDWTIGCIAVTNPEIEELWRVVPDGTPIEIRP